ncbi:MAG: DUF2185 domain-containing protein [Candidatus Cloacimonetes bacterium]|nr:DUF2185 domain-containing protein [Candidatus Cloacimonadota bacterium]
MTKQFYIDKDDIQDLIPNLGAGIASDQIMVDGAKIQFMYRGEPENEMDSGWCFFSGGESDEYLDDPENTSIFTLNTISNYDSDIIPFLSYPVGTEVQRNQQGQFMIIEGDTSPPDVIFLPPIQSGFSSISKFWTVQIPFNMYRRVEKDSIVLWTKEVTIWLNELPSNDFSIKDNTKRLLKHISPKCTHIKTREEQDFNVVSYQLTEDNEGHPQHSLTIFGISALNQMVLTIYYENLSDLSILENISKSLRLV